VTKKNSNKCTLKCSADDYADLYIEAQPLYRRYNPIYFIKYLKGDGQAEKLAVVNVENPLGIPNDELRLPIESAAWDESVDRIKVMPAYNELMSDEKLIKALKKYLKYYGVREDDGLYQLYLIRFLSLLAYLFAEYISDSEKPTEEMVVSKDKRKEALEAAMFLRNNLSQFIMATEDEMKTLKLLLKAFGRYNNTKSRSYISSLKKTSSSGSTNHALRLLGINLVFIFMSANKTGHSALVGRILKSVCSTVGPSTVERYISEAKDFLIETEFLLDHLVPGKNMSDGRKDLSSQSSTQKKRKDKYTEFIDPKVP